MPEMMRISDKVKQAMLDGVMTQLESTFIWYAWVFDQDVFTTRTTGRLWWRKTTVDHKVATNREQRRHRARFKREGSWFSFPVEDERVEFNGVVHGANVYAHEHSTEPIGFIPFQGNTSQVTEGSVISVEGKQMVISL